MFKFVEIPKNYKISKKKETEYQELMEKAWNILRQKKLGKTSSKNKMTVEPETAGIEY